MPASHFLPLFYFKSPSYSPPSKTTSYSHLHHDSSSFQTIFLPPFPLVYTPFNLSLLFFVNLHTSLFCNLIPNSQYLLSFNCSLYPPYILGSLPPTLTEPHSSLALSTTAHFTCSHICFKFLTLILFYSLTFRHLGYLSVYCYSLNFSLLTLLALFTISLVLPMYPPVQHDDLRSLIQNLSLLSQPANSARYLSSPTPDLSCSLLPFYLGV